METAFAMMFKLTRSKTECLLHGAMGFPIGTFYGLLFEPYFHRRITEQGYSGKIRKLTANPPATSTTRKREWYGRKKSVTEVVDHTIPVQALHHFHTHTDIQTGKYNVPDRKNFAAVDSLAPGLGEMYQVTSGERHAIKAIHLRLLKKYFANYLATGEKVKLIFVVPPNRFGSYRDQKYVFPAPKTPRRNKKAVESNDTENESDDSVVEGNMISEEELLKEVTCWVDQYVLEVNVDPLVRTFDRRIEASVKKSFAQRFRI
jgi:hypothetical protein